MVDLGGASHPFTHPMAGSAWVYNRLTATGSQHMPQIRSTSGQLNQPLTDTQIEIMHKWSQGTVTSDWNNAWGQGPPHVGPTVTPGGMDKAALENCVGGAFFPGIEAGIILTDASKYLPITVDNDVPCFRLDHSQVSPGDLTAKMALPWQNDFHALRRSLVASASAEQRQGGGQSGRPDWQRGFTDLNDWVAGKWNKMGFVTLQGGDMLETDRCDAASTSVSLVTPSLTFLDVPQGPNGVTRKAARAIVFEVHSSAAITINVTNPADPSLVRHTTTPYTVPATGPAVATVRIWITYAAPNTSHNVSDSVTATCTETGQTWAIPITANSVPRQTATAALVLDKSGSMSEDRGDGQGTKSVSLRDAASTFADVMLPGDSLSLTLRSTPTLP